MKNDTFLKVIEDNLSFEYCEGGIVLNLPRGFSTDWRSIPYLILSHLDNAIVDLAYDVDASYQVHSGETVCLPPGARHCYSLVDATSPEQNVVCWTHTRFRLFGIIDIFNFITPPRFFKGAVSASIEKINADLVNSNNKVDQDLLDVIHRKALGFRLLELVVSESSLNVKSVMFIQHVESFREVMGFIERNLHNPIDQAQLSLMVNLSPSRLNSLFHQVLGISVAQYIQRQRLDRALHLLLCSSLSVKEIAAKCGYCDEFYFSRRFKAGHGCSPLHYRISARENML